MKNFFRQPGKTGMKNFKHTHLTIRRTGNINKDVSNIGIKQ